MTESEKLRAEQRREQELSKRVELRILRTMMIGKKLLHYEITDKIGAGGMGEVYRARDGKLGREVAIKILPTELSDDPERIARFNREAPADKARAGVRGAGDDLGRKLR